MCNKLGGADSDNDDDCDGGKKKTSHHIKQHKHSKTKKSEVSVTTDGSKNNVTTSGSHKSKHSHNDVSSSHKHHKKDHQSINQDDDADFFNHCHWNTHHKGKKHNTIVGSFEVNADLPNLRKGGKPCSAFFAHH